MTTYVDLTLDLSPLTEPDYTPAMSLADRFAAFHAANQHVADALEHLAAQWLERHDRVGIKALVEALRWRSGFVTGGSPYKLDNSFTAFYSRLLLDRRPEWTGRILIRRAQADHQPPQPATPRGLGRQPDLGKTG